MEKLTAESFVKNIVLCHFDAVEIADEVMTKLIGSAKLHQECEENARARAVLTVLLANNISSSTRTVASHRLSKLI